MSKARREMIRAASRRTKGLSIDEWEMNIFPRRYLAVDTVI